MGRIFPLLSFHSVIFYHWHVDHTAHLEESRPGTFANNFAESFSGSGHAAGSLAVEPDARRRSARFVVEIKGLRWL